MLFTKNFWIDAGERAVATFAQVVLSISTVMFPVIGLSTQQELQVVVGAVIESLPLILLTGLGGAGYSVLKSLAAAYKAGRDTASLVDR